MHTDKLATVHLIELLVQKGVKDFIISPGSRNAPIIMELVNRKDVNLYSIADERSAAFVAIGMYLKTKSPVAITCTSGSALLNYAPGVSEAFYQGIPLFVLSADRPSEWLDQGEGQMIRQQNALQNFVVDELNIGLDSDEVDYKKRDLEICTTIDNALNVNPGPVHFNIEYEEPLYQKLASFSDESVQLVNIPKIESELIDFSDYSSRISNSSKVMVLCGQMIRDAELSKVLEVFSRNSQVVVLTESTSNLYSGNFIPSVDKTLLTIEKNFDAFTPDILITIGDAIISKIVKRVLRKFSPKEHWQISSRGVFRDTYRSLSDRLQIEPSEFFTELNAYTKSATSDFSSIWKNQYSRANEVYQNFKENIEFSDLIVFDFLFKNLDEESDVHIANSSPIRYQQLFENKKLNTMCNRGTSGIDGCSSTALGYSIKNKNTTWLITGDISFLYDSNAWWNNYKTDLKIILINNGGGGIFRIIPGPSKIEGFETYFETQNQVDIESLCKAFKVDYIKSKDVESLSKGFDKLKNANGITLLEIFTPREKNALILNQYFDLLRAENGKN